MGRIERLAVRIHRLKIVNRWAILGIDTILSAISTMLVLFFINEAMNSIVLSGRLVANLAVLSLLSTVVAVFITGLHKSVIRHFSAHSIAQVFMTALAKMICVLLVFTILGWKLPFNAIIVYALLDLICTTCVLIGVRVGVILVYDLAVAQVNTRYKSVLVYGVSSVSVAVKQTLNTSKKFRVVGFIDPKDSIKNYKLAELPVRHFSDSDNLNSFMQRHVVDGIIYPSKRDLQYEADGLVSFAQSVGIKSYVIPNVDDIDKTKKANVQEIKIEDLLGRTEIQIDLEAITDSFAGKVVLVTGAAGSIGSELCRQLATLGVSKLVLFDNAETPMHNLSLELSKKYPALNFVPFVGDVRSKLRLSGVFEQHSPQVVFHAAAYKHVPLMEDNPYEAVAVNVTGTRYVAEHCVANGVEKMVMVSTDKAVNPTNVMGASKRLAEIYVQSLGLAIEKGEVSGTTKFVTTRFGNVLGSNGSVIPYFRQQIEEGGPITVTHPDIIRYFMTIPEACRLVMEAASMSKGNDIFVFDMGEPVKINDLAIRMIRLAGLVPDEDINIVYTGLRPGEKLYEELLSNDENTLQTPHAKIRIARVREYDYNEILTRYKDLRELSEDIKIVETVSLMKDIVPEFLSRNSVYEALDKR